MSTIAYLGALALALTMLATGLGFRGRDLLRIGKLPGATVLGLGLQLLLLPMAAALLAKAVLPGTTAGFGLILASLAPASAASYVFVGLGGGNTGLARTLTLCSSFTILVVIAALKLDDVLFGIWPLLIIAYILPLLLGMALQILNSGFVIMLERRMTVLASVLTGLVALATLWQGLEWVHATVFFLALVIAGFAGLFGWAAGRMLGSGKGEAIGLTLAMRNFALPLAICLIASDVTVAVAPVLYAIAMYLVSFALIVMWRYVR